MGESWHNFIYAAYDPAGTINVDKPPVALWIQVISTKLFGFNGVAIIAPIAIAGTIAVPLVFAGARRSHGVAAGLIAAAVLAVFPESVSTARDTTMDPLLMMGLAAGGWLLVDAVESRRPWRIVAWAALMGVLFNVKFFQGFIVMPAALLYIVWSFRDEWRVLVRPLAVAALVGAIVSFSWIALVDLTPKDDRPIVMNDKSNSELGLALRYNGLERVLPGDITAFTPLPGEAGGNGGSVAFGVGNRGPGRLIRDANGALIGLGVCLALGGLGIVALRRRDWILSGPGLFWGTWLVTGVAFFSASNRAAAHYNEAYVPAVAVLAGVGLVEAWRARRRITSLRRDWGALLGPAVLGLLLLYAVRVFSFYDPFRSFGYATIGVGLLALAPVGLALLISIPDRLQRSAYAVTMATPIVLMLIISGWITFKAPPSGQITRPNPLIFARGQDAPNADPQIPAEPLLAYGDGILPDARYRFAISGINDAGEAIAYTGASILPVWNNYQRVPVIDSPQLVELIQAGDLPFLLVEVSLAETGLLDDLEAVARSECLPATVAGVDQDWRVWDCSAAAVAAAGG